MKKNKFFTMLLTAILFTVAININVIAAEQQTNTMTAQINQMVYLNHTLLTSDQDIMNHAVEDSNQNSIMTVRAMADTDSLYYENGILYGIESTNQKQLTQLVSTAKTRLNHEVNNYVDDYIISANMTKTEVAPEDQNKLKNDTYYTRAALESITKNKTTVDSSIMGIRYTVYYSTIQVNGGTAIAIGDAYGKIVYCTTDSGIKPTSMDFYSNIFGGGTYNEAGDYLGIKNPGTKNDTVPNPGVGENVAYKFTINNLTEFFYIGGDSFTAGTSLAVKATRGTSVSIDVDLSNV